jgi:hypothetical protein
VDIFSERGAANQMGEASATLSIECSSNWMAAELLSPVQWKWNQKSNTYSTYGTLNTY